MVLGGGAAVVNSSEDKKNGPIYVKKWVKTKYALLFRLSCR